VIRPEQPAGRTIPHHRPEAGSSARNPEPAAAQRSWARRDFFFFLGCAKPKAGLRPARSAGTSSLLVAGQKAAPLALSSGFRHKIPGRVAGRAPDQGRRRAEGRSSCTQKRRKAAAQTSSNRARQAQPHVTGGSRGRITQGSTRGGHGDPARFTALLDGSARG